MNLPRNSSKSSGNFREIPPPCSAHAVRGGPAHALVLHGAHHGAVGGVGVARPHRQVLDLRRLEGGAEVHGLRRELLALLDPPAGRSRHLAGAGEMSFECFREENSIVTFFR